MSLLRIVQSWFGKRSYGYKADPPDARDVWLSERLGAPQALPRSGSVRSPKVKPKDQSSTSSCVGQGTSQCLRDSYLKAGIECPELSALFPYYQSRAIEGQENNDNGTVIRDAIKALVKWGECDEASWPFKVGSVNKHPSFKAYHNAYDRRGSKKYYRIAQGDADGVRQAIAAGYAVVAGWSLNISFEYYDGRSTIQAQDPPFVGGHCMCVDEFYENGEFGLINSWGEGWGASGYARVSEGFVKQATDIWALEVV